MKPKKIEFSAFVVIGIILLILIIKLINSGFNLLNLETNIYFLYLVLLLFLLFALIIFRKKNSSNDAFNIKNKKLYVSLFVILALLGILSRCLFFWKVPNGLNQDEMSMLYDANTLLKYGIDHNGFSFPVYLTAWGTGQSALLAYLTIPFVAIFGMNVFTARIVMVLCGISAMFAFYWLILLITKNKTAALVGLAIFAINPWSIMASRWGLDCNLFPFVFIWGVCFLLKAIEKYENRYFMYAACFFFGISLYCYAIAWMFLPLFLISIDIYLFLQKKIYWKTFLGANFLLFVLALPLILFVFVNLGILSPFKIGFISIPKLGFFRIREISVTNILPNLSNLFISLLFWQNDGLMHNSIFTLGFMYLISTVFLVIGIIKLFYECRYLKTSTPKMIILISFLVALGCSLLINNVNINKVNILWLSYLVIMTLGILEFVQQSRQMAISVASILMVLFVCFVTIYFTKWNQNVSPWSFHNGLPEAIKFSQQIRNDSQKIYFDAQLNAPYICCLVVDDKHPQSYINAWHSSDGWGFDNYVFEQKVVDGNLQDVDILITHLWKYRDNLQENCQKQVMIFNDFVVLY